jgi:hypothetical protein
LVYKESRMQMSKLNKKILEKGIWETKNRNAVHRQ